MNDLYTISHLVQFTGLTDRTIRMHLHAGFLQGVKINGIWHFTPEQVEAYIRNPAVAPGILAKANGMVYDFLMLPQKTSPAACIILDLPDATAKAVADHFCYAINNGSYSNLQFSFRTFQSGPRVILTGDAEQVLELTNSWLKQP